MGPAEFRHALRVRYAECDAQGHVFFAHYPAYLDVGITELWRARAGGWQAMVDTGHDLVVAALEAQYRGSARFDDVVDVVVAVERFGETSMTTAWRIERDGDVLVHGTIRHVCVDPETHAKKRVPDAIRAALS
jgi:acyl-CoA thioester hydrolase